MMGNDHKMISGIIVCVLYLAFAVLGMTFIKSGHGTEGICTIPVINVSLSLHTIIGVLFYGLSFILFTFYVSGLNIGIIVPVLSGLTCIAIVIIGRLIFRENINMGQYAGIVLIVIGTVLVGVFR